MYTEAAGHDIYVDACEKHDKQIEFDVFVRIRELFRELLQRRSPFEYYRKNLNLAMRAMLSIRIHS